MTVTSLATVSQHQPEATANMTARDICEYCRENWQFEDDENGRPQPVGEAAVYMHAVADAIFDPEDWKNPFVAIAPECGLEWAAAAAIWFHGDMPSMTATRVIGNGYQCW